MPELPEIETIRRGLVESVLQRPILEVAVNDAHALRTGKKRFVSSLQGKKIADIRRRGKMLIFVLGEGPGKSTGEFLLARLGMTGRLVQFGPEDALWGSESYREKDSYSHRHCRIILRFKGGHILYFCDPRKFGYREIVNEKGLMEKLRKFGPEPLEKGFTLSALRDILKGRKTRIKALLLNQACIAGIGNIYADEVLFDAGILPTRIAGSLTEEETRALYRSIRKILKKAVEKRGTSFSDYVDASGKEGGYQKSLKIYGRKGQACKGCEGKVQHAVVAGRGTNYCPVCQK
jgi:formamidopyrimidine-DNA glycosylase